MSQYIATGIVGAEGFAKLASQVVASRPPNPLALPATTPSVTMTSSALTAAPQDFFSRYKWLLLAGGAAAAAIIIIKRRRRARAAAAVAK